MQRLAADAAEGVGATEAVGDRHERPVGLQHQASEAVGGQAARELVSARLRVDELRVGDDVAAQQHVELDGQVGRISAFERLAEQVRAPERVGAGVARALLGRLEGALLFTRSLPTVTRAHEQLMAEAPLALPSRPLLPFHVEILDWEAVAAWVAPDPPWAAACAVAPAAPAERLAGAAARLPRGGRRAQRGLLWRAGHAQ